MAKRAPTKELPKPVQVFDPAILTPKLKAIGGSNSDDWNNGLANQVNRSLYRLDGAQGNDRSLNAALAGLIGIQPKDELEAMLAGQLLACHHAAMECYRRAAIPEQTFLGRQEALSQANKLSRTQTTLLEALNRHRGKGQQKVTVEHVHVHAGGQAIVGNVGTPGGGVQSKSKKQPDAKQIVHAPQPEMRSTQQIEREALPVPRHEEWTVPDARREIAGRAEGK